MLPVETIGVTESTLFPGKTKTECQSSFENLYELFVYGGIYYIN